MFVILRAVFISAGTVTGATLGYAVAAIDNEYWSGVLGDYVGASPGRVLSTVFGFTGYLVCSLIAREVGDFFTLWLEKVNTRKILLGVSGIVAGLLVSALAIWSVLLNVRELSVFVVDDSGTLSTVMPILRFFLPLVINLSFATAGWAVATRYYDVQEKGNPEERPRLMLDTSVLIDGRVEALISSGFMPGIPVVPKFVLFELQYLADASEKSRRDKGHKALDVVSRLRDNYDIDICPEEEAPKGVDAAIIKLASTKKAAIVTNDRGLAKLAALDGVKVLNVQDLAAAMHTPIRQGDTLFATLIQPGREPEQGVGYLEDGSMVVVEDGRRLIGREIELKVTKTIATSAGRLVFAVSETDAGKESHEEQG